MPKDATATPFLPVSISKRERLMLAGFMLQNAKAKGPIEERALLTAFDEFGLSDLVDKLDGNVFAASADLEDIAAVTAASISFVGDILGKTEKTAMQVLVLRPLADRLAKALAN